MYMAFFWWYKCRQWDVFHRLVSIPDGSHQRPLTPEVHVKSSPVTDWINGFHPGGDAV